MKKVRTVLTLILWFSLTSGCALLPQVTEKPQQTFTQLPVTAAPTIATALPAPESTGENFNPITPEPDIESGPTTYALDVLFENRAMRLEVYEQIIYLNQTGETLEELPLIIPPNHTDAQFELQSLVVGGDLVTPEYTLDGVRLLLELPEVLEPEGRVRIELQYGLNLPNEPGVLGYTWRQINVCDWYAFIPAYLEGSGWMVNDYHPIGEYLVYDVADFDVSIRLKSPNPDLTVVGSVPGRQTEEGWVFHADQSRTFVWTASENYRFLSMTDHPYINAYVFPEDEEAGWAALAATISAWDVYSHVYGEPIQEFLFLIEADFYDGMEYDGLFFLGYDYFERFGGDEKDYLTIIAAHETAHQWWFAAVGNDAANEPWLDEALATYSEWIFYETLFPQNGDWWWDYRVAWFQPQGKVDSTIYRFETPRPYINAVYLRGAELIDEIREKMGDEAFFAFLQAYYEAGTGKIMTREDFFSIAAEHTDADIECILWRYFER
ncbi:MAG: hypothetical protein JXA25_18840 [Anaerolineales bacterium]|nr:hypothetical protein [Anaerolineales bacterium]